MMCRKDILDYMEAIDEAATMTRNIQDDEYYKKVGMLMGFATVLNGNCPRPKNVPEEMFKKIKEGDRSESVCD